MLDRFLARPARATNIYVFLFIWFVTLALYLPAAKAGWVIDAPGTVSNMLRSSFWDFINNKWSTCKSFYQVPALSWELFYYLWGMNPIAWSLVFISTHAVNAYLLYRISRQVMEDSGYADGGLVVLLGIVMYITCPHISEPIIWKACYHYLMGFYFQLLIIRQVIRYQQQPRRGIVWGVALAFAISAMGLEVFFITPFYVLIVALYYRYLLNYGKQVFKKTILYIVLPQVLMFVVYFVALKLRYQVLTPHIDNAFTQTATGYLSKPPKLLFHMLVLGRYWPVVAKNAVYAVCANWVFIVAFYGSAIALCILMLRRYKQSRVAQRPLYFFGACMLLTMGFLLPLSFPDSALLVFFDRYLYFPAFFVFICLVLLLNKLGNKKVLTGAVVVFVGVNLFFTLRVNGFWKHSAYVTNRLLHDLPDAGQRKIILLNLPENMMGVPMIGADPDGQYKAMRSLMVYKNEQHTIYDALSYNLLSPKDGAHIEVLSDSCIRVTLNQWGTWWWYEGHGGRSYTTPDYRIDLRDPGHMYEIYLTHPAANYLLLYQVAEQWKVVDMGKRGEQY